MHNHDSMQIDEDHDNAFMEDNPFEITDENLKPFEH